MKSSLLLLLICQISILSSQGFVTFTPDPSYTSLNNAQCIDAEGEFIHVVWTEEESLGSQVYYIRAAENGNYWENESKLAPSQNVAYPSIAVENGVVHVVYMSWLGGSGEVLYSRSLDNGDSWEGPVLLSSYVGEGAYPSIAVIGQTVHIVWQDKRQGTSEIFYKRSENAGDSWSDDLQLTSDGREAISASMVLHKSEVHLIWQDNAGIQYQKSDDAGITWSDDVLLSHLPFAFQPTITVSENIVMAMWSDSTFGYADLYTRRSTDSGLTWADPVQPVENYNPASSSRIASKGNFFYIVWNEMWGDRWAILKSFSTDGGLTWDYPIPVNFNFGFTIRPFVVINGRDVHVICTEKEDNNQDIRYQRELKINPFIDSNKFEWGHGIGSEGSDRGNDIITDDAGNVYIAGQFSKTVDFDPGPGTKNLVSAGISDIFISKFDSTGHLIWAVRAGGTSHDGAHTIALDKQGNVYATGYFKETIDFDPGASTFQLQSGGFQDIFIWKLDPDGNFIWAKTMGSAGIDIGESITIDAAGRVITVGTFSETVDFNPGTGVRQLTSNGNYDIFISILNKDGQFISTQSIGSAEADLASSVITDNENSILVTGSFEGAIDFDFGPGVKILESNGERDIFILKLNSDEELQWAVSAGGENYDTGMSLVADTDGSIYSVGKFYETIDIDPGPDVVNLPSNSTSIYLLKLDKNGLYRWALKYTPHYTNGYSLTDIVLDDLNNIYLAGAFSFIDIDPQNPNTFLRSNDDEDIFLTKLNPDGKYIWANQLNGLSSAGGSAIALYSNNDIYTTGYYLKNLDLDQSTTVKSVETPYENYTDIFLAKIRQCAPRYKTVTETACENYLAPDGVTVWTESGTYRQVLITIEGCDSVVTVHLTINNPSATVETITACDQYTSSGGNTWSTSGTYQENYTNAQGCDSTVTYQLTINNSSSTLSQITSCNTYTTPDGNHTWTSSGIISEIFTSASGCDSLVSYDVTIVHDQNFNYSISSCDTYTTPDGAQSWSASGIYNYTISTVDGCDSLITVDLTITEIDLSIIEDGPSLTSNQANASYQWFDCDNGLSLAGATSQTFQPLLSGNYSAIITVNGCVDTSACYSVMIVGTYDSQLNGSVSIYPNPAHDYLHISFSKTHRQIKIEIVDLLGHGLYASNHNNTQFLHLQPEWVEGIYFVKVTMDGEEEVFRVVVE